MRWFGIKAMLISVVCISSSMAMDSDVSLYKKKGCAGCHGGLSDVAIIKEANAPLIDQIAKKYRGQPDVEKKLVEQMIDKACKGSATKDCHPELKATRTERLRLVRFMLAR